MSNYRCAAIALIVLALFPASTPSQAKSVSHKSKAKATAKADPNYTFIKQAYDYQSSGFPAKDANIIMAYTTQDFAFVTQNGVTQTKDQYMQRAYQTFVQAQYINPIVTRTITIHKATFSGYTAIVEESWSVSVTAQSSQDPNKTVYVTLPNVYYQDTWVRTPHGWAEQKSILLGISQ